MNILFFYALILILTLLICVWVLRGRNPFVAGFVAAVSILITRLLQSLPPFREPWHDGYFYSLAMKAILANGSPVAPEIKEWYPGIDQLLSFPVMHVLTAILSEVTGITDLATLRAVAPAVYSIVTFCVLAALASQLFDREYAIIIGYTITQLDTFISYQTQYHPQQFGVLFFALFLFILIYAIRTQDHRRTPFLFLTALIAFAFSHRFSSLAITAVLGVMTIGLVVYQTFPWITKREDILTTVAIYMLIASAAILIVHVYIFQNVVITALTRMLLVLSGEGLGFYTGPATFTTGSTPTILDRMDTFTKVLLATLALPTILSTLSTDQDESIQIHTVALGACGILGAVTAAINFDMLVRYILFAYIPLTLLAFHSIHDRVPSPNIAAVTVTVTVALVMMSVMAATVPSLIDPTSDVRADGFHDVTPMHADQEKSSGDWVKEHATTNSTAVTMTTRMAPLYYGEQRLASVRFLHRGGDRYYHLVDPERRELMVPHRTYDNGRIIIGVRNTST